MVYRASSKDLHFFLLRQEPGTSWVFFVEDLDFYVVSKFDGELYRLGFIDLRLRVGLKAPCETLEEESTVAFELKDVPWSGMKMLAVFSLYPLHCVEGGAEGAVSVKFNVEPHWLMYDWLRIARAVISMKAEDYVRWLSEKFGPVDAVRVV